MMALPKAPGGRCPPGPSRDIFEQMKGFGVFGFVAFHTCPNIPGVKGAAPPSATGRARQ